MLHEYAQDPEQQIASEQHGDEVEQATLGSPHVPPAPSWAAPPSFAAPPSPVPVPPWTVVTHCAEWLCAVTAWNGSQNAGNERSVASSDRSGSTMIAAIQICGAA
jgi:hypothetical protein